MSEKRISLLIISLAGGGGERAAAILANHLNVDNKMHLTLLNDTITYELDESIPKYMLDNTPLYKTSILSFLKIPWLAWKYKRYCQKNKIDTSISVLTRPNLISGFSRLLGNKSRIVIWEVHTPSQKYGSQSLSHRIATFLIGWLYKKSDLVIANSKGTCIELKEHFGVKNATAIYNPLELDKINEKRKLVPNKPFDTSKFTFIMVARFQPPKDHLTLIKAFSKIDHSNAQLLLLGVGENKAEAEELVSYLNLTDKIIFIGFDVNPFAYHNLADCFVFSTGGEGFPNAMQEALACGLPVISTDCKNGPREILKPGLGLKENIFNTKNVFKGDAGLLVPIGDVDAFADAMTMMMTDKRMTDTFKENMQSIVQTYKLNLILEKFVQHL